MFLGAGAAGIGIARLISRAMRQEGASEEVARRAIVMLDSHGLVYEGRTPLDEDKREFAFHPAETEGPEVPGHCPADLESVVAAVRPTVLIGTSSTPGAVGRQAVETMASHCRRPILLLLSNPTANCEAQPEDVLLWSEGRALIATGSPFEPVLLNGRRHLIGQANNVLIFPGIGLGAIVAEASELPDEMFLAAATTLGAMVSDERLDQGALYPSPAELRTVSREIALVVVRTARDLGVGRMLEDERIPEAVDSAMWFPSYASSGLGRGGESPTA